MSRRKLKNLAPPAQIELYVDVKDIGKAEWTHACRIRNEPEVFWCRLCKRRYHFGGTIGSISRHNNHKHLTLVGSMRGQRLLDNHVHSSQEVASIHQVWFIAENLLPFSIAESFSWDLIGDSCNGGAGMLSSALLKKELAKEYSRCESCILFLCHHVAISYRASGMQASIMFGVFFLRQKILRSLPMVGSPVEVCSFARVRSALDCVLINHGQVRSSWV